MRLGYNYLGVDYDKESATGLEDSTTQVRHARFDRIGSSERDVARFGFGAARFDPDDNPDSTDAYSCRSDGTGNFPTAFEPEWTSARRCRNGLVIQTPATCCACALRAPPTSACCAPASCTHCSPAGYGDLVESDTLDLTYQVDLSSRLDLNIDGSGYRTRQSSNQSSNDNNERDYVEIGPELTYAFFESLRVGATTTIDGSIDRIRRQRNKQRDRASP